MEIIIPCMAESFIDPAIREETFLYSAFQMVETSNENWYSNQPLALSTNYRAVEAKNPTEYNVELKTIFYVFATKNNDPYD